MDIANGVTADIVTKTETVTIGEIFSYIRQEAEAWFECTSTIGDVMHGSVWYYISCGLCSTKATKGHTSLMCKKCGKAEVPGVPHSKIFVYDNTEQTVFMLLGDVGRELTGKEASELVRNYFEANESVSDDHLVPVPQALLDTIGQTRKFIVKVSGHNWTGKTQDLTVTKVLHAEAPQTVVDLEAKAIVQSPEKTLQMGDTEDGSSIGVEEPADERVKKTAETMESEEPSDPNVTNRS